MLTIELLALLKIYEGEVFNIAPKVALALIAKKLIVKMKNGYCCTSLGNNVVLEMKEYLEQRS